MSEEVTFHFRSEDGSSGFTLDVRENEVWISHSAWLPGPGELKTYDLIVVKLSGDPPEITVERSVEREVEEATL